MEISNFFNKTRYWCLPILTACTLLISTIAVAEDPSDSKAGNDTDREIHVTADRLISDRNSLYAEFIGNVVATRQGAVLTSDKLKIFYKENKESDTPKKDGPSGALDKIVATGNVKVTYEDKIAYSEKAVYSMEDDTVVLTGGNPRVFSGKSFLTGDRITLHRTSGKVFAESSESSRVTVEYHPEDKPAEKKNAPETGD